MTIADNLHPMDRPSLGKTFPHYGSVTETGHARRLHCSGATSEPGRCKSCYVFLAGTECVLVRGARSVKNSSKQCKR